MSKSLPLAIGLFLFSIYLLSFSGKFHVMDELAVFTAGHNLAQYRRADINQLIWTNHWTPNPPGIWGNDGNLYTKKPPGISFITAPLIGLGHTISGLNAVHVGLLTNALVTALTASFLFIWLIDLGFVRRVALLTTLGYGLCTFAWVYARMFWESSLLALSVLVAVWAAYRATYPAQARPRWAWLFWSGLAMAISLTLRFEAVLALVLIGFYLAVNPSDCKSPLRLFASALASRHPSSPASRDLTPPRPLCAASRFIPPLIVYLAPSLLMGLGLLYFNFSRFGSLGETGYTQEILFRQPWVGAFGLLFSPGRGLFIYSPLLLLLFFGLRPAWRRLPALYFWLIAAICLGYWLFYGAWFAWGGTWGWGPRFLLPILPLLMLFIAEPIAQVTDAKQTAHQKDELASHASSPALRRFIAPLPHSLGLLAWLVLGLLAALSLFINFLGLVVDFNEHFLRLGANDNFVFNWAAFPPLAHWQILQEGLVDLIWLRPGAAGLEIEWPVLLPALTLFVLATGNLIITYQGQKVNRNKKLERLLILQPPILLGLAIVLTYLMMSGTARVALLNEQAQLDLPVVETLNSSARPGDALLVPMPPFGDVQEISTRLMAYLSRPLPTYVWIESEPRAIQPAERGWVWQAIESHAQSITPAGTPRIWLFERWLTQDNPPTLTANRLNQAAFPIWEQWFERSGKLTLYALATDEPTPPPTPLNIPFQGGLTLVDFMVDGETFTPGDVLKLRLTWQAAAEANLTSPGISAGSVIAFAQLLTEATDQKIAQSDRLLVDLQHFKQSPLLPGQTVQQGYGLQLPADLAAGAYPLVIGLYQADNGQRLPRADGSTDDFLYLTTVRITASE